MTVRSFFACALLMLGAIALTLPDCSEAARMGGGRSFGGKAFMSKPAPKPRTQTNAQQKAGVNQAQSQQQKAGAAAAPGRRPGMMGGLFGGLLAGTLLGSLLAGNGFSGGGLMDILLIGLLVYLGFKLFAAFRNRRTPAQAGAAARSSYESNAHTASMHRENMAGSGWDNLRTNAAGAASQTSPNSAIPQDFDVEEFLRGAKLVYNRLQASWDKRDLADISQFATPAVQEALREQMASDPQPSKTEIVLLNAQLLSVEEEDGQQYAQVFFDPLLRETPDQETPSSAREIWHFVRSGSDGNWKLDGMQQVE